MLQIISTSMTETNYKVETLQHSMITNYKSCVSLIKNSDQLSQISLSAINEYIDNVQLCLDILSCVALQKKPGERGYGVMNTSSVMYSEDNELEKSKISSIGEKRGCLESEITYVSWEE